MGCSLGNQNADSNIKIRQVSTFLPTHDRKYAIFQSIYEQQIKGTFLDKILNQEINQVQQKYDDIVNGKINLTDVSNLPMAQAYLALFYLVFGENDPRYINYKENIIKFQNSDLGWLKVVQNYLITAFQSSPTYIYWKDQPEKINFSTYNIPNKSKLLLFGDWGTGFHQASVLMNYANQHNPDVSVHLGDVYYSGTIEEQQKFFVEPLLQNLSSKCRKFSLPGNHDYYSGGEGYQNTLKQLGQKASYICLENDFWTIIGLDTAWYYFKFVDHVITHEMAILQDSELEWVKDKVEKALSKNKKIIFMSHHQLFSGKEPFYKDSGQTIISYNENLLNQLGDIVPKLTAWYWAHEHNFIVYKSFKGLLRGRLIGNGSCMSNDFNLDKLYEPFDKFTDKDDVPQYLEGNWKSKDNGQTQNCGYTILELNEKDCLAQSYEVISPSVGTWTQPVVQFQEKY